MMGGETTGGIPSGWYSTDSVNNGAGSIYNASDSFKTEPDTDWWASISDTYSKYDKPINGIVGGAMTEGGRWYQEGQKQDRLDSQFSQTREDTNAWREEQLAMQREQLALQAEQLALQQATLEDKIQTRARHNASIAVKPASAKKVSFGGK